MEDYCLLNCILPVKSLLGKNLNVFVNLMTIINIVA